MQSRVLNWPKRHWLKSIVLVYLLLVVSMWAYVDPNDSQQRNEFLRTAAQLAGAVFLGLGLVYTRRTVVNSQETLKHQQKSTKDQRFFDASKLLFDENNPAAHIGALYTLEQLSNDSDDYYDRVIEVICAFVRYRSAEDRPRPKRLEIMMSDWSHAVLNADLYNKAKKPMRGAEREPRDEMDFPRAAHDIEVAMTILVRRGKTYGEGEKRPLDLRGAHLSGLRIIGGDFREAMFDNAVGINTTWLRSNLDGAKLDDSDFRFAWFSRTRLQRSWFRRADLRFAWFNYDGTINEREDASRLLDGSFWFKADMRGAEFWCKDMSGMDNIVEEQYESLVNHVQDHIPPNMEYIDV